MADHNVTLQTHSCKDSQPRKQSKPFPYTRQLTVLETATTPRARAQSVGVSYIPVQLEPCIVLSGKWLRDAGFATSQKVAVQVSDGAIKIQPIAESDLATG